MRAMFIGPLIILVISVAVFIYSFQRCGWGMLAYENAFIAALTGECAQQQRLHYGTP